MEPETFFSLRGKARVAWKAYLEVQNPADVLRQFHFTDILIALHITQNTVGLLL